MAGILAAGNRAMVKPSEYTERVAEVFAEAVPKYFAEEEMAVFTGGVEVGTAFSKLAFDHLIFTGATSVGKHIMRAAADNLVPVTLELGGKSPTIIGRSADKKKAGRTHCAGQDDECRADLPCARLSACCQGAGAGNDRRRREGRVYALSQAA
jgi:coniferyl-aldehyde dehydrogenase